MYTLDFIFRMDSIETRNHESFCSSVVEHSLMTQKVPGSNPAGGETSFKENLMEDIEIKEDPDDEINKEKMDNVENIPGFTCENVDNDNIKLDEENIKKYKCETCGKAFSRSESLKNHISSMHNNKNDNYFSENEDSDSYFEKEYNPTTFKCKLCEKEFKRKQHLKRHMANVHKEQTNGINNNPWLIGTLDDFLYYCCPECDQRNHTKELFVQHALGQWFLTWGNLPNLEFRKVHFKERSRNFCNLRSTF